MKERTERVKKMYEVNENKLWKRKIMWRCKSNEKDLGSKLESVQQSRKITEIIFTQILRMKQTEEKENTKHINELFTNFAQRNVKEKNVKRKRNLIIEVN